MAHQIKRPNNADGTTTLTSAKTIEEVKSNLELNASQVVKLRVH